MDGLWDRGGTRPWLKTKSMEKPLRTMVSCSSLPRATADRVKGVRASKVPRDSICGHLGSDMRGWTMRLNERWAACSCIVRAKLWISGNSGILLFASSSPLVPCSIEAAMGDSANLFHERLN